MFFSKIINSFIRKGHKQRAENLIILCLKKIKHESKKSFSFIFKNIMKNSTLMVELRHPIIRHKKTKYPYFVSYSRIKRLSIKNIMKSIKKKSFKTLKNKIFNELFDIMRDRGLSVQFKKQLYFYTLDILPIIDKFGKPVSKKRRGLNRA